LREKGDDVSQLVVESAFLGGRDQTHVCETGGYGGIAVDCQRQPIGRLGYAAAEVQLSDRWQRWQISILSVEVALELEGGLGRSIPWTLKVHLEKGKQIIDSRIRLGHEVGVDGQILKVVGGGDLCKDSEKDSEEAS